MFVGRDNELRELKEKYSSNKLEFIAVLGRRRIGKTQLIFNSYQDFDGLVISYQCSDTGYFDNLRSIEEIVKDKFNYKFLHFDSLSDVMLFLVEEAKNRKILFVIDEYPYMRDGKKTDSEIKNAIDEINKKEINSPFKMIICGSAVNTMNILDDATMPLHGRFTKIINLTQLDYLSSSYFYKDSLLEEKVKYYAVFGGIPYFLKQINPQSSFDENIINLFFASNALLKTEIENQINGEINRVENASMILNIIKDSLVSYSDLLSKFRSLYPNVQIDYALKKLLQMKVLEKINIEQDNGKNRSYYRIADNTLVFYYTYLNKEFSNRLIYSDNDYYERFIKESLYSKFIPTMFEKIGFQFVALMNKNFQFEVSLNNLFTYIINDKKNKRNYQFDVVGETSKGLINFECKFQDSTINMQEVYKENRQAELANNHFYKTVFISKSLVNTSDTVYYLEDVYNYELLEK